MRQVFLKQGQVVLEEVPPPLCTQNYLLIANRCSLISSGTESHSIQQASASLLAKAREQPELVKQGLQSIRDEGVFKTWEKINLGKQKSASMGYSSSGVVVEVGKGIAGFKVGDRVACGGYGWASHSEMILVPEKLTVGLPAEVEHKSGAFTTLGSIALHGVHRSRAALGEHVAVIGLGLIGLITIQILKAAGCQVIGLDVDEAKVELGRKLGLAQGIVICEGEQSDQQVLALTNRVGVDATIICASTISNAPLELSAQITRQRGRVVALGGIGLTVPRDVFYYKELSLHVPCSYGPGRHDLRYEVEGVDYPIAYVRWSIKRNMAEFVRLLAEGSVQVEPLISREFPLDEAAQAYQYTMNAQPRPIGVLLSYPETAASPEPTKIVLRPTPKNKDKINLALLGCGNIAQAVHLPTIKAASNYQLAAVVARTAVSAKSAAECYQAGYFTTSYDEVLNDKDIDMVFISTRHRDHCSQIIKAAKAGKAILAEKPLALSEEECQQITATLTEHPVPFSVGYNRRYSSLSQKACQLIGRKSGPLFINYRINAGFIPLDHWCQDEKEGGRILGEVCHFVDYCNYLTKSRPKQITAQTIPVNQKTVVAQDNISASLSYEDGSLATIIYTSLGPPQLLKEYIEIFFSNSVIVIEDFRQLRAYGFGKPIQLKLRRQDKGFSRQLDEFYKLCRGESSASLTLEEALLTTRCTLKMVECLNRPEQPTITIS